MRLAGSRRPLRRDALGSRESREAPVIRQHFSKSLEQVVQDVFEWVKRQPRPIRAALGGAALVYMFIIWRGGLIILPIAAAILLLFKPAVLLQGLLFVLVVAPGAGFLGGLLYGATEPFLRPFGRAGRVIRFVLGTWVYCLLLVFFIIPAVKSEDRMPVSKPGGWIISGFLALLFGIGIGLSATSPSGSGDPPDA